MSSGEGADGAGPTGGVASPLPAGLEAFVERFNRGHYWESHEVLEGPWRAGGSAFYKGLILYASAFVHLQNANAHGVRAQLAKAVEHLTPYAPAYLGIDVTGVLGHAAAARRLALAEAPGWAERVRVPPLLLRRARVRGDEVELRAG